MNRRILLSLVTLVFSLTAFSQSDNRVETVDIDNFWNAYDRLNLALTDEDSIRIIQEEYLNKASNHFREFIQSRKFTAKEYVKVIGRYPKFWKSVRPVTTNFIGRKGELANVFDKMSEVLPNFIQPDVCFAIGCLRTGGTTTKGLILLGAEIALADSTVDKSELPIWLRNALGNAEDIVPIIAHEAIHTQQFSEEKFTLQTGVLAEGIADFITVRVLGFSLNTKLRAYGANHECGLWKEYLSDLEKKPDDVSRWLYNGGKSSERPPDLGYYIGFRIAESYYSKQKNKTEALKTLLNFNQYSVVFKESGYGGNCK